MTTLITGAGLIGRETAALLAKRGEKVVLGDIRRPECDVHELPGVEFAPLDVCDAEALCSLIARHGIGRIVHTAAMLSNGMRADPVNGLHVNLMGTANVLDAARRAALGRVVTISSTTVLYSGFASLGPGPIPEDAALRLVSDRPRSLYAMTKLTNEYMGHLFHDIHGVDHVALRFGAVLGGHAAEQTSVPGQLFDLLVGAARSGGTVTLDNPLFLWCGGEEFVDLRDCARAIRAALDADAPRQGVYNIAHPRQWTLGEIVSEVARQKGAFECVRPKEVETGFAGFPFQRPAPSDLSAAEAELGFVCRHDLTDTLDYWW